LSIATEDGDENGIDACLVAEQQLPIIVAGFMQSCGIDPTPVVNPGTDDAAAKAAVLRLMAASMQEDSTGNDSANRESARKADGSTETVEATSHSDDFHTVVWFGSTYNFTTTQAACVKQMWENWNNKLQGEHEVNILEKAGSAGSRLRDVFRGPKGTHSAWKTMIVSFGKGVFGLKAENTQ